ncbi:VOC family protein [Petropleomorpha daqingensis]|uniref:Putative enzyme related to lactoylglutathione lyase n=1 Tax=Petropleomorpha daqingensis TaxID=2026353 RepID=A0A853CB16_9ACTN|nr:VOC family protein [Petropleomorpha daqingensis]NYJ04226.1 putative enzyme related to lactoylglutathione lyase [Petropleomorpha daqingensis]
MDLASIRLITADVPRLVAFYERVTGAAARWSTDFFAELVVGSTALAVAGPQSVGLLAPDAVEPAANRSVLVEFLVEDVDRVRADLGDVLDEIVAEPTTMPWGNRSLLVRDPDGNLVNIFTPSTAAARERFGR